jgi:VWFA-related protein
MSKHFRAYICVYCLFCLRALAGQANAPAGHPITLDVVAIDKSGKPVRGLTEQDFTLLDNKQVQKITSFHAVERATADSPSEVILVVDEVNDSFTNVAYERGQIVNFLKKNDGELTVPTSIVFFSDSGATAPTPSTLDAKALIAALTQNQNGQHTIRRSQGFYGASDRVQLSLRTIGQVAEYEAKRPGRKLVVWVSPGWPLLTGPHIELSSKNQQEIFNTIVALSTELREARITLYSLDPLGTADSGGLRTSYYKEFLKGVKGPSQVQFGNLGLQVLAYQSGGRVLNSSNDVSSEIATCISDANAFYVLSFESAVADGPNDYHALDLKIDKPGITARTRSGYYAQPEQAPTH